MTWLGDGAIDRLRARLAEPEVEPGRYRLLGRLGTGGMGSVWLAEDLRLGREVALKVIDLPDAGGQLAARLEREARVLARLEHPGIVPVHEVGRLGDGRAYYAMKRVEGERLDRVTPRLAARERVRLLLKVAETVAFAHARQVVHRDLKPANIMVGPFGEVLVLDWGLAKALDEDPAGGSDQPPAGGVAPALAASAPDDPLTAHGAVLGTPGWMAPEQARGDTVVDRRADVYALGGLLRFLLERPGDPPLPRPLRAVIERAQAVDPAARYPDAGALAAELAAWLEGARVAAHREGPLGALGRLASRHRVAIILVLTYLVVRALLIWRAMD